MDPEQFGKFMKIQQEMMAAIVKQQQEMVVSQRAFAASQTGTPQRSENSLLLPNFENFDPLKESFRNYKLRFSNYVDMKGIANNKSYCAKLLLNSIGAKHFNLISALAAPKQPGELEYDELMSTLDKHLDSKKSVLVAQHQFLSKYQGENQSIAEFVAVLRTDIGDCEFYCTCKTSIADIFLRTQFIRGLRDNSIREKILQSELTDFNNIVDKAIALEAAKINSKELSQKFLTSTPGTPSDINRIEKKKKVNYQKSNSGKKFRIKQSRQKSKVDLVALGIDKLCLRCGRNNHLVTDCRTDRNSLKCSSCNIKGHIEKVCIRTLLEKNKNKHQATHQITSTLTPRDFSTFHIEDILQIPSRDNERFYAIVKIEGKSTKFEVDSGSAYTFLPRDVFKKLNLTVPLLPASMEFRSYTHDTFVPDGKIEVNVEYNGTSTKEEIYIVPEDYSALLGRIWIRHLNINLSFIDQKSKSNNLERSIQSVNVNNEIFSEFSDIFEQRIGCIPNFKVSLKLREGAKPIFHREREIPYALTERVNQELDSLEQTGIITKVETSDWGSPLVVIPKVDNQVRLCVDYKIGVNERLIGAHYPIRKIDDILNQLRDSKFFCKLDLYKAYLHIPVDEPSSQIQTISTHRGTYKVNRLSFGIKTAPSEFNRIIDQVLRDVPGTEAYFDDIIVRGGNKRECYINLIKCLNQLRKYDLHVNKDKCEFFQQRLEFLGHVIEENRISKAPSKIEAIMKMPIPESVDDVRSFLGLVTYYTKFIPKASNITAPLRQLLKKDVKFKWTYLCEKAFNELKKEISSDRVLIPYNPELPVTLACDASPVGIAGVLSHIIKGEERPIAFASRSLTSAEKNYSQLDREALAIVFSVDHFFQYLFGRKFNLVTDNQPLARIFHQHAKLPAMAAARLQRYAAFLSGFNYEIKCKRGVDNGNADCLSRAPIEGSQHTDTLINAEVHDICEATVNTISTWTLTFDSIRDETAKDAQLSKLLAKAQKDNDSDLNFIVDNNIIFKGQRVVIPSTLQPAVLEELHRTHVGITRMKQLARRYVYWTGIDKDIEHLVRSCTNCASVRHSPPKAPLHPWAEPENNWQRIHIDYAGPLQGYQFLIVVDAKSKWAEIETCRAAPTSTSTIQFLKDIFSRHGFPDVMVQDNAAIFTSEEFRNFCRQSGIFQKFIAPGHPATNGLAERNVQTLKNRVIKMNDEPVPMREKIREILFRYRATPLNNGKSPAEMYLHRSIRFQLDTLKPTKFQKSSTPTPRARQLSVGERVQARYYSNNKNQWKPGTIIKKFGNLHYQVRFDDGYMLKRHIDQFWASKVQPDIQQPVMIPQIPDNRDLNSDDNPVERAVEPNLGDIVVIPDTRETPEPINIESQIPSNASDQPIRRSNRQRQQPAHLRHDYIL